MSGILDNFRNFFEKTTKKVIVNYAKPPAYVSSDISIAQLPTASYAPTETVDFGARMEPYKGHVLNSASKYGIPYNILASLIDTESTFNPKATSKAGAVGIAQLMPDVAKKYGIDPTDPQQAIETASKILKHNYELFGNWKQAIAAYNSGISGVSNYGENLPKGLSNYVEKILSKANFK
jgi:soluble lytic murein transglycosylase-like protein